jgi:hypothetical protein
MPPTLHIVEPTLEGQSGHCHSFIASLCGANPDPEQQFVLWVARGARLPQLEKPNIRVRPYFFRRIRRLQAPLLLRGLLSQPGRVFLATAERADLFLLNLASRGKIPEEKVFLYFHWSRKTKRKLDYFKKIARRHPDLNILGPTSTVVDMFRECGFRKARLAPYPITPVPHRHSFEPSPFRHLLFAGAAREDKGFSRIVAFIEYLAEHQITMPFSLQTSPDHYGRYDAVTGQMVARLEGLAYPSIRLQPATLNTDEYYDLFRGGICLQLYNQADFADRISGITLDALSMGCPVVALANTWMATMVERFGAGCVVEGTMPEELLKAAREILANYPGYQDRACHAGSILQAEHSPTHLLKAVTA